MKRGKYETPYDPQRHSSKKALALLLSLVLVIGCIVGGTLAWLTAESGEVKNVFTTSDIGITLEESKNLNLKMVPGWTITKDPKATVTTGSEDCYLFVKVEESANFDTFMTYKIADGWNALVDEDNDGFADDGVYYREVTSDQMGEAHAFAILDGNKVTVKDTVTKEMMNAFDTDNDGSLSEDEQKALPTLTFTAYAHQLYESKGNKFDVATAWGNLSNQ